MDKEELQVKLDEIKSLVNEKDYESAVEIVDDIDWKRVKNVRALCMAGEVLAANKKYEESRDIFLLAYHRSSVGKTILYRLVEVSLKLGDLDDAMDYYRDFVNAAPNDSTRYLLKYKIYHAKKAPIEEQIQILEDYKEKEFTERWAYELAKLYNKAGEKQKCIDVCDDLFLWFHEGKYVVKSLELKKKISELSPSQQKVYDDYNKNKEVSSVKKKKETEKEIKKEDHSDIPAENQEEDSNTEEESRKETEEEERSLSEMIDSIKNTSSDYEEDNLQKKISYGIRDIFHVGDEYDIKDEEFTEKQITGQINIADIIPEMTEEEKDKIPSLEPEGFDFDRVAKLNIPKVNLNENAKVEDLPISEDFSLNLEDTIIAAAEAQGINVPDQKISDKEEHEPEESSEGSSEESSEEPLEEAEKEPAKDTEEDIIPEQEPETVLSEEEELMRFIDEQNKNPDLDERDIVPREEKLDDDEIKLFKYFSAVPGMKEQIVETLKDVQAAAADKTSNTGNVIIMGNKGSGKTMLSDLLIKAICRELNMPAAKVAKVKAGQLKNQDIAKIVDKMSGGYLLIQDINQMDADTVNSLNQAMQFRTDGLTVFIEDEKIGMRKFIARNPKFIEKFTSTISIPVFTNDELVNFAKFYARENGYVIDDMAILALYTLISINQKEDEPMTVDGVRMIINNAIAKEQSGIRKLQRNLSGNRTDRDGLIILYEKDFK